MPGLGFRLRRATSFAIHDYLRNAQAEGVVTVSSCEDMVKRATKRRRAWASGLGFQL